MQLAVQLYTLRHLLEDDLEATLAALAEVGAREVELAGLYGRSPAEMRAALEAAGLVACAAHVPLDGFEAAPERVVEAAETLGTATLVVPSVPPPETAAAADATIARIVVASEVAMGAATRSPCSASSRAAARSCMPRTCAAGRTVRGRT